MDVFGLPKQTIPKHRLLLLELVNGIAPAIFLRIRLNEGGGVMNISEIDITPTKAAHRQPKCHQSQKKSHLLL